jgi:hypothetical protein
MLHLEIRFLANPPTPLFFNLKESRESSQDLYAITSGILSS